MAERVKLSVTVVIDPEVVCPRHPEGAASLLLQNVCQTLGDFDGVETEADSFRRLQPPAAPEGGEPHAR